MNFKEPIALSIIANLIEAKIIGEAKDAKAKGINELSRVEVGDLAFVDHPKYYDKCINSSASFIIINKELDCPKGKALLVCENPFKAYIKIVETYFSKSFTTTPIANNSNIGEGTIIYPNVFVGSNVTIGNNCIIYPNVSILENCIIGNNVVIQSGTVIGSDAFYYNTKKDKDLWFTRMQSCGRVVIFDNVEIGASCTIDRGVTYDTQIGVGTKIDNMVHIGHDTIIGKNCLIAAQVGIAGACTLEDGVTLWGQVGVNKTLTIGKGAVIMAQSGIPGNVEGGKIYWGSPIDEAGIKKRELVWIKRIPELWKKVMS